MPQVIQNSFLEKVKGVYIHIHVHCKILPDFKICTNYSDCRNTKRRLFLTIIMTKNCNGMYTWAPVNQHRLVHHLTVEDPARGMRHPYLCTHCILKHPCVRPSHKIQHYVYCTLKH